MPSSSAYITVLNYNQTYHFTGVLSVRHTLSLKISESSDSTELAASVNGAKNKPDKVTLSVIETDAAHSAAGWASRMLDVLASVKQRRLLCRVCTPHHTYDNMLLSDVSVTQDEEHPDGWAGDLTFTECTSVTAVAAVKTADNSSAIRNVGSSAPAKTVSGTAAEVPSAASALSGSSGRILLRCLSLQSGSTLEQKLSRAGISTDMIRYIL